MLFIRTDKMKKNKRSVIKWLPPIPLFIITFLFVTASLLLVLSEYIDTIPAYTVYSIALYLAIRSTIVGIKLWRHGLKPWLMKFEVARRFTSDFGYKTLLMAICSLSASLFFAVTKLGTAVYIGSWWLCAFAAYYIILALLRIYNLNGIRVKSKKEDILLHEHSTRRNTGFILLVLTAVFYTLVNFMYFDGEGLSYPRYMIYVAALYTFTRFGFAIKNFIKAKKNDSPLTASLREISGADALVSVVSLQSAMFYSFATEGEDTNTANAITGLCVCALILALALYIIISSNKRIKKLQEEKNDKNTCA